MAGYGRIVISRFGGPEVLDLVEDELRDAREGEVRVKVLAAGVSWVERMMRRGSYPGQPKPPFTPGYDVVGVVDQRGPGASRFAEGDRVAALMVHGGYAEYVYLREEELVPVPAGVDPAEAVCLVLNYVTAYQMLHRTARLASGHHPDWFQEDLTALFNLLAEGKIHPVITARIPWREARRAQEILDQGAVQGKLVLTFS